MELGQLHSTLIISYELEGVLTMTKNCKWPVEEKVKKYRRNWL